MSTRGVQQAIRTATSNDTPTSNAFAHVDAEEALDIVKAAFYGRDGKRRTQVTKGEAKAIVDLFDRQAQAPQFGTMDAPTQHTSIAVSMDAGAVSTFKAFFAQFGIEHESLLKGRVESALRNVDRGDALSEAPCTDGMTHVFIRDSRPVDGDRLDAYVDGDQFYLQSTGAGMGGPDTIGPYWYGPFDLTDAKQSITVATRRKLMEGLAALKQDSAQWFDGDSLPIGLRFERVPLGRDGFMDGFQYEAFIPTGAVRPGFEPRDPNEAQYAWIKRSGGLAGMMQLARIALSAAPQPAA